VLVLTGTEDRVHPPLFAHRLGQHSIAPLRTLSFHVSAGPTTQLAHAGSLPAR
jgi:hypothetical protein